MWDRVKQWLRRGEEIPQTQRALAPSEQQMLAERVERLPACVRAGSQSLDGQTLVVFDLEATGLDRQRDTVLSIGAVRITPDVGLGIELGRTFERTLAVQVDLKPDSQLFHGLTAADLAQGQDPRWALLDLLEWGQGAVWLAWHAWFDEAMLHRAARQWLGLMPSDRRLPKVYDLAHAMPIVLPQYAHLHTQLDAWLGALNLGNAERHHAVADAMATAELSLVALAHARLHGFATWGELTAAMAQAQTQRDAPGFA